MWTEPTLENLIIQFACCRDKMTYIDFPIGQTYREYQSEQVLFLRTQQAVPFLICSTFYESVEPGMD